MTPPSSISFCLDASGQAQVDVAVGDARQRGLADGRVRALAQRLVAVVGDLQRHVGLAVVGEVDLLDRPDRPAGDLDVVALDELAGVLEPRVDLVGGPEPSRTTASAATATRTAATPTILEISLEWRNLAFLPAQAQTRGAGARSKLAVAESTCQFGTTSLNVAATLARPRSRRARAHREARQPPERQAHGEAHAEVHEDPQRTDCQSNAPGRGVRQVAQQYRCGGAPPRPAERPGPAAGRRPATTRARHRGPGRPRSSATPIMIGAPPVRAPKLRCAVSPPGAVAARACRRSRRPPGSRRPGWLRGGRA